MKRMETFLRATAGRPALVAVAAGWAADDASRRPYAMRDGVALIDICGLLGDDWYCQTSYDDLQNEIAQAVADAGVRAIALCVNSPGGYTDNAFETAAAIASAAKTKPLVAVVTGVAYSGAYLLASQAQKIYVAGAVTGGVGSIGVYCEHDDYSGYLKRVGIDVTLISAGEGKVAGNPYEPLTPEAKASLEAEVQRLYGEFTGSVARGRGMTAEAVVALGAHLYEGSKRALSSGLADQVGGLDEAISALAQTGANGFSARAGERETTMDQAAIDKLAGEARAAGFGDAEEIVELCVMAGKPAAAAGFLAAKKTAKEVRTALLTQRAEAGGADLGTGAMPGSDAGKAGSAMGKAAPWKEIMGKLMGGAK